MMVKPTMDTSMIRMGMVCGGTDEMIESDLAKGKDMNETPLRITNRVFSLPFFAKYYF
jgi:hypothetical protein